MKIEWRLDRWGLREARTRKASVSPVSSVCFFHGNLELGEFGFGLQVHVLLRVHVWEGLGFRV